MAKSELIDSHVSVKQCKLAIDALHTHALKKQKEKEETELLTGKEQNIWLQVAVKKMHPEKKIKPIRVPIKHPLVDPRTSGVCLITKDPQRLYKDLLEAHGIKFISRVVGITKLKGKFKPFEARRMLLKENGLFLADERVIPLLPGLLGRKWFDAKKQPIPVCLTRKDLKAELERAIESTYMHQNQGTCTSVKIGILSHTPAQILSNLKMALPTIAKYIKGGWENIQSLQLKSNFSASLPIWTCDLGEDEGGRWDGLTAQSDQENSDSSEEEEENNGKTDIKEKQVSQEPEKAAPAKRTKRPLDDAAEKPKKKAKAVVSAEPIPTTPALPAPSPSPKATKTPSKKSKPEPVAVSVSQAELKQKRSSESGEKKKAKVLKGKGSKSAKEKILGKKSSQA
ncbi:hypothetical protein SERLA73DRAFT_192115 [Serpula lacrymans var. lacrymans S7.3]|uniref:Ribosomal L1 domain-containing protein 1 n=2 Tax=Serpula lacrymans var. lacrymans TaxID=341189 RepID=F8QJ12_SERL3|nr:uncharacterized protein SERLADRAFT_356553 [Serpula lacrymans var. lacrymans S7.9]EGN91706.1 hypothetical protein SERLA73DRAFT_192115 [Serpula lacrymans var. lacrymans S7.3]EGO23736.1 hypothetical protein SERLADRAFT_356553 [Serpula lacrymans var. lacrymans S7.9]